MGEACSTMGDRRGVYRVLVGRPEGKRQRDHLEDNIMDSSGAVYGHVAGPSECGSEPSGSVKCDWAS